MGTKIRNVLLILVALTFTACPQLSVSHVETFPHDVFRDAEAQIAAIATVNPHRTGKANEIHILVYDGEDGDLVRISFPITMMELGVDIAKSGDVSNAVEGEFDPLAHMSPGDLRKLGPGLLVQVDDEDEDSHVLIWLT